MKKLAKPKFSKSLFIAFFLSFSLGMCIVAVGFILGGGTFYLGEDYNLQQISFHTSIHNALKSGDVFWSSTYDLGTNFIGAYSFYNLASPFVLFTALFPPSLYQYLLPLMIAFKAGVCGLGAYMYSKQYINENKYAYIASLLYTFSSYQLSSLNYYHFMDLVALFPFLLLALDKTCTENKKGVFAVMVAIITLTNYVFFFGATVFLVLYFAVKCLHKEYTITKQIFLKLALESVLGVGMACVILMPSVMFVTGNPRATSSIFSGEVVRIFLLKFYQLPNLLHAFILPSESIMNRGFIATTDANAPEAYLPVVGFILAGAYICNNKKNWVTSLSLVSILFMFVPVLNSAFSSFNAEYYPRWFYMPILIFSLASAKALEQKKSFKGGFIIVGVLFAWFYCLRMYWHSVLLIEFMPNRLLAFILLGISFAGIAVTLIVCLCVRKKYVTHFLTVAIFFNVTAVFALNTYYMHDFYSTKFPNHSAENFFNLNNIANFPQDDEYYRIETQNSWINAGIITNTPSVNSFASAVSPSIIEFYFSNDIPRYVYSTTDEEDYGFNTLLGSKYNMLYENEEVVFDENENFAGMGFIYGSAVSEAEYAKIDEDDKHIAILGALVLPNDIAEDNIYNFNMLTAGDLKNLAAQDFESFTKTLSENSVQNFAYENSAYTFSINSNKQTLCYVSVPYDEGFTAYVNGERVDIVKVNAGFIGVPVIEGENEVVLSYYPKGLNIGIFTTILSLIIFVIYLNKERVLNLYTNRKTV